MADVITRFRLETTQYDSKLRDAAKGLKEFTHQAQLGGKNFTDFSQKAVESARALGTVASGATNTKEKVRDLVGAYNEAAKAYNSLSEAQQQHDFGKNLAASLETLKGRITKAKQELYGLGDAMGKSGGGGLFSGLGGKMSGALQVFAGNLMTKGAGMLAGLASEMGDMVKQGIELAKQGEGIRNAFERLGRGDILDGLREATHGTVTDIELMKAAVKFNDFKLPLEELGTMLAFAQQKAKDTGQSVDYMVDSIVTGLGRKSLMILDNLGLSATEVKARMAETGDMTKAVGEIIREQMAKAGEYMETAADRAAQANVSLQNKMEELGRKFAPVEEASTQLWTSMKISILDVVGGPLARLLNGLTEAGQLKNMLNDMNGEPGSGNTKVQQLIGKLSKVSEGNRQGMYDRQVAEFYRYINRRENYLKERQRWVNNQGNEELRQKLMSEQQAFGTSNVGDIKRQIEAAKIMLADYRSAAKQTLKPIEQEITPTITTSGGTGKGGKTKAEEILPVGSVAALNKELSELQKLQSKVTDTESWKKYQEQIDAVKTSIAGIKGELVKIDLKDISQAVSLSPSGPRDPLASGQSAVSNLRKQIQAEINADNIKIDEASLRTLMQTAIRHGIDSLDPQFGILADKIGQGLNVPDEAWEALQAQLNEKLQAMGIEPIKLNLKTGEDENGEGNIGKADKQNPYLSKNKDGKQEVKLNEVLGGVAHGMQGMASGLDQLGIDISGGLQDVLNGMNGVTQILTSIMSIITAIEAISSADALVPFANGGVVRAAAGWSGVVPGNSLSGDNVPALLNSGEVVLNHAQVAAVANELQSKEGGGGLGQSFITGEQIHIVHNRYLRRVGEGEIVTWKNT